MGRYELVNPMSLFRNSGKLQSLSNQIRKKLLPKFMSEIFPIVLSFKKNSLLRFS